MSICTTGLFEATVNGVLVRFDGAVWSSHARRFDLLLRPALAEETPFHLGQHIPAQQVARKVLDSLFPGDWQETKAVSDSWPDPLPDGAID